MYDELIKRLRELEGMLFIAQFNEAKILIEEAADAIEELTKDIERSKEYEAFWEEEANKALRKF